jgi:hypothetical protein
LRDSEMACLSGVVFFAPAPKPSKLWGCVSSGSHENVESSDGVAAALNSRDVEAILAVYLDPDEALEGIGAGR